jgi:MGT family glycosyltransferase
MAAGLSSDTFRVVWVVRPTLLEGIPPDLPETIRVEPWVPSQRAVLEHPNVRVFVSHCGINSAHESLAAGTPLVGIPLFADQEDMALRVRDAGVGLTLRKDQFTPDDLRESVSRVIRDDAFRRPIRAIQSSFELAGGVRRAADLIEHAAWVGTNHYRTGRQHDDQSQALTPANVGDLSR